MNQCFWTNLLNEWFNDSLKIDSFVTGWISVFEWMIQWLTQDWLVSLLDESVFLNEWFNDSLKIDSFRYWMNQCFEWISWMMIQWLTPDWLVSLLMNQCFWMNRLNEDSMTQDWLVFSYWMNQVFEWISWMNDSMTHSRLTRFVTRWISVFERISWMNDSWLTQDWLVSLLDESVFLNDSKTNTYLTAIFST